MRLTFAVSMAAAVTILGLSGGANATPQVRLVWSATSGSGSTGGESITVSDTEVETLTLDMVIDVEDRELIGVFVSVEFDQDLADELSPLNTDPQQIPGLCP